MTVRDGAGNSARTFTSDVSKLFGRRSNVVYRSISNIRFMERCNRRVFFTNGNRYKLRMEL